MMRLFVQDIFELGSNSQVKAKMLRLIWSDSC